MLFEIRIRSSDRYFRYPNSVIRPIRSSDLFGQQTGYHLTQYVTNFSGFCYIVTQPCPHI